ncbi:hypothetical protein BD779DRAFT_473306 [Infundibulicybe gibba]|nr:hypothetical protein BD779DRAFT_473306 [Infundibulicybe gibba]
MVLVNSMPIEIIRIIFLQLCSPETMFPPYPSEPRLVVTHVCSQWHAIAFSIPTLWNNFDIHVHACDVDWVLRPGPTCAWISRTICAWISRTARSTLSFDIRGPAEISSMIVDLVFPIIHRCAFLDLQLDVATLGRF